MTDFSSVQDQHLWHKKTSKLVCTMLYPKLIHILTTKNSNDKRNVRYLPMKDVCKFLSWDYKISYLNFIKPNSLKNAIWNILGFHVNSPWVYLTEAAKSGIWEF